MGPLKVRPQLSTGVVVSKIGGTDARTQVEGNVTASLAAEIGEPLTGRFLTSNYSVASLFGENRRRSSDVDQSLNILGQYDFDKLRLGAGVQYTSLSGDDREFTNGTQRQVLTISLTSTYQWTERTSFDFDLTVPITEFDGGLGSGGVTATTFVNYAFTPRTLFGLGFAAGYLNVDNSDAQVFEQVLVRVLSTVSPYFLYYATAGVDFRDYGGGRHVTHPVFALGATWTPREGTLLFAGRGAAGAEFGRHHRCGLPLFQRHAHRFAAARQRCDRQRGLRVRARGLRKHPPRGQREPDG